MKALLYRLDGTIRERELPYHIQNRAFWLTRVLDGGGKQRWKFVRVNDPPHNGIAHCIEEGLTSTAFKIRAQEAKSRHNSSYANEMLELAAAVDQPNFWNTPMSDAELQDELTPIEKAVEKMKMMEEKQLLLAKKMEDDAAKNMQQFFDGKIDQISVWSKPTAKDEFVGIFGPLEELKYKGQPLQQDTFASPSTIKYAQDYNDWAITTQSVPKQFKAKPILHDGMMGYWDLETQDDIDQMKASEKSVIVAPKPPEPPPEPEIVGEPKRRVFNFDKENS